MREIDLKSDLLNVYKPISKTPFEMVQILKKKFDLPEKLKVGYAGRLDPLAHGVLLLMVGDMCKQRDRLQLLEKTYRFKLVFGLQSDSYDPMGIVQQVNLQDHDAEDLSTQITEILSEMQNGFMQPYPSFSSFHVKGKPLYRWFKEGLIETIEIPSKQVFVKEFQVSEVSKIAFSDLVAIFTDQIRAVNGDFRQSEIVEHWENAAKANEGSVAVVEIELSVSSGTYIRSIANEIGARVGSGALAYEINRIKAGEHSIEESWNITS